MLSKHTRLVATVLFAVIILLAVAITRFYMSSSGSGISGGSSPDIARVTDTLSDGSRIFQDSAGSFGIVDSAERLIVAPEWQEIRPAGNETCLAAKNIGGETLWGCIDLEGNIVVPFIYSSMIRRTVGGLELYTAECAADGSTVVYSSSFVPFLGRSWKGCSLSTEELTLSSDMGSYTYYVSGGDLLFKRASAGSEVLGCDYTVDIVSRVLLSKLTVPMIEKMTSGAGSYIEYAFGGSDELLSDLTAGSRAAFARMFPGDHKILSKKLLGISDVYIYAKRSEDGKPHYLVTVTAETEITYTDQSGQEKTMEGEYKAEIEYSGGSESELTAVSGSFTEDAPVYPAPEPPPGEDVPGGGPDGDWQEQDTVQDWSAPAVPDTGISQSEITAQAAEWRDHNV